MELKGKILEIEETQQVTNTFQKREFIVEYADNPSYPEYVKFELIQDRCPLLDSFAPNDEVNINFNLKGRKWTNPQGEVKYFNSLQAWKIDKIEAGAPPADASAGQDMSEPPEWVQNEADDDLPF